MSYQYQKLAVILFLISLMGIFVHGCSREVLDNTSLLHTDSYDFLDNLASAEINTDKPEYVAKDLFTINGDSRSVLFEHPNSEIVFESIPIQENAKLKFGIALRQEAWDKGGDGVLFEINMILEEAQDSLLFSKYIDPKNDVEDRKWFEEEIDLSSFAGKTVSLAFRTQHGPNGNPYFDWAGWSSPQITSLNRKARVNQAINLEKTKYDLIEEFPRSMITTQSPSIKKSRIRVKANTKIMALGEEREVILANPPSEFGYHLTIPYNAFLEFGIGVVANSEFNGITFEVYVNSDNIYSKRVINSEYIQWNDERVSLTKYGGKKVNLRFKTVAGSQNQNSKDPTEAGWSNLRITEVIPIDRSLSSKDKPNVILVVIDTQRADHLSCYGYNRDTSPTLNKIAQEGLLFETAISQSSWTWPATATILTGLYPYTHGVTSDERSFLDDSIITLSELLQENHFTTVGISANFLISKGKNFNQGFETFIEMPWISSKASKAEDINHKFYEWLETNKNFQFFAYLHYMDPHDRYSAPGKYQNMFASDYEGENDFIINGNVHPLWEAINFNKKEVEYTEADIEHLMALYDGEIRYWDSQFSALLERLKKLNVLTKTIIIVTSDHGEEFLEHGKLRHGLQLYDESIRVPLIIWNPEFIKRGRIEEQVETVDIYPTICKILGIEIPGEIQGKSLFPVTELKSLSPYAYSQTEHAFIFGKGRVMKNSIRTTKWKLIFTPFENKYELYSILDDENEKTDLFANHPIGVKLKDKLEQWVEKTTKLNSGKRQGIDRATLEKLRSLGYIK